LAGMTLGATFEQADRSAGPSQPGRGDTAPVARPNDDRVVAFEHGLERRGQPLHGTSSRGETGDGATQIVWPARTRRQAKSDTVGSRPWRNSQGPRGLSSAA